MELLDKLVNLINRDTRETGDQSDRLYVVLRVLVIFAMIYTLMDLCGTLPGTVDAMKLWTFSTRVGGVLILTVLLLLSYRKGIWFSLIIFNFTTIGWIAINVYSFGWEVGYQQFFTMLLVLTFFSGYRHYGRKIAYGFLLLVIRLLLAAMVYNSEPHRILDVASMSYLQLLNTLFVFVCIGSIAFVFSRDVQENDVKLLDERNKLEGQANTDPLTGLYNRRKARALLDAMMTPDSMDYSCICICDIDFFKRVNDTYGHDVGDVVLKRIADTMNKHINEIGFVARWGGEEFLIAFPHSNGDEAFFILDQLRHDIKKMEFQGAGETFHIAMTFGLAEYDYRANVDEVIKKADDKLYFGKENGRDRIVY